MPEAQPCSHGAADRQDNFCPDCGAPLGQAQVLTATPKPSRLPFSTLFPLSFWWKDRTWRSGVPLAFLVLAVAPFVLVRAFQNSSVGDASGAFTVYFAVIWLVAIRALVKPESVSRSRLAVIIVFTAFIGTSIAVSLERQLANASNSLAKNIFDVGLPEEFAKALPIFLIIFLAQSQRLSPRTYLYLGAVSGLAFGAAEAVTYSVAYASVLPTDSADYLANEVWRLITDPLIHGCWAGITCYFIGLASTHRNRQVPLIAFGLAIAVFLHGAYDTSAGSWLWVLVAAFSVFVFLGYALHGERIVEEYRAVTEEGSG
jgi:RsiW-degrading membrane proteinase PrsW (M82 family)